jgi:NADH:ubiquinone oxidoreductase subunit D
MMETLVIVSRAHAETAFGLAHEMYLDGDTVHIFFTGRGTHHCGREETVESLSWANLYTFETEFDSTCEAVNAVGYDFFVERLERCERTFSWI